MVARERICEVYGLPADPASAARTTGSGILLRDRLILTAAHVVSSVGTPATVRLLGAARTHHGTVAWRPKNTAADAAFIRLNDSDGPELAGLGRVRLGQLVCTQPGVPCQAVGFPRARSSYEFRDTEQLSGWIRPLGLVKQGRVDVVLDHAPAPLPAGSSPGGKPESLLYGMSGAGLFVNGALVGVIAKDESPVGGDRVSATSIAAFADEPGFAELVWPDGTNVGLEPAELAGLQQLPVEGSAPGSLLRADAEAVRFRGREAILDELLAWCDDAGRMVAAWLITGPGGQGKSRLGRHLAAQLRQVGWATVILKARVDAAALEWLASVDKPLLLVVDYAEHRGDQLDAVADILARKETAAPVRVLLLARSDTDWRDQLTAAAEFIATAPVRQLGALPELGFPLVVSELAPRLATVPGLTEVDWPALAEQITGAGEAPPPGCTTVLEVQLAALAALLRAADLVRSTEQTPPISMVARHEYRYWDGLAAEYGVALPRKSQLLAVVAATLLPVPNAATAGTVLGRVPEIFGHDADRRAAIANWLHTLYPGERSWWGAPQPELLADHFVAVALTDQADLLDSLLVGAPPDQIRPAVTVLARAADQRQELGERLSALIARYPERLVPAAIAVATETHNPAPLIAGLRQIITTSGRPGLIAAIVRDIPQPTRVLANLAAEGCRSLADHYRRQLPWPQMTAAELRQWLDRSSLDRSSSAEERIAAQLAAWAHAGAKRLGDLGELAESQAASAEAVTLYRSLAERQPAAYLPKLASALHTHAVRVVDWNPGHQQVALKHVRQALAIRQQLAAERPDRYLSDLASSFNTLSNLLAAADLPADALDAAEQAVDLRRRLAQTQAAELPRLAISLNNLSARLSALRRLEEAVQAVEEAVEIYRELVRSDSEFRQHLAAALDNLAGVLSDLGQDDRARRERAAAEAVRASREFPARGVDGSFWTRVN